MAEHGELSTSRVLRARSRLPRADRPPEYGDDVCFNPDLVAAFIEAYTEPGDLIFDPFAGFGTTLRTAEQMGRRALGFEIDESRVTFARRDLADPTWMRHVDVREADWSSVPGATTLTLCRSGPGATTTGKSPTSSASAG